MKRVLTHAAALLTLGVSSLAGQQWQIHHRYDKFEQKTVTYATVLSREDNLRVTALCGWPYRPDSVTKTQVVYNLTLLLRDVFEPSVSSAGNMHADIDMKFLPDTIVRSYYYGQLSPGLQVAGSIPTQHLLELATKGNEPIIGPRPLYTWDVYPNTRTLLLRIRTHSHGYIVATIPWKTRTTAAQLGCDPDPTEF